MQNCNDLNQYFLYKFSAGFTLSPIQEEMAPTKIVRRSRLMAQKGIIEKFCRNR